VMVMKITAAKCIPLLARCLARGTETAYSFGKYSEPAIDD
jgi:hypothetical protein